MRYLSLQSWSLWLVCLLITSSIKIKADTNNDDEDILTEDIDDLGETVLSDDNETDDDKIHVSSNKLSYGAARLSWMIAQPKSLDLISIKKPVKFVVNFINEARSSVYTLHHISSSFRYPADLNYVLQNLTSVQYGVKIHPGHVHTFKYGFLLYDEYTPRSVVFIMEALYTDELNEVYRKTLLNETLSILEADSLFDGELIFMYILLIGLTAAILFAIYHFTMKKLRGTFTYQPKDKKLSSSYMSGNIISKHDVDLDWIPKEHIQNYKENRQSDNVRNRHTKTNGYASNEGNPSMTTRSTVTSTSKKHLKTEIKMNGTFKSK